MIIIPLRSRIFQRFQGWCEGAPEVRGARPRLDRVRFHPQRGFVLQFAHDWTLIASPERRERCFERTRHWSFSLPGSAGLSQELRDGILAFCRHAAGRDPDEAPVLPYRPGLVPEGADQNVPVVVALPSECDQHCVLCRDELTRRDDSIRSAAANFFARARVALDGLRPEAEYHRLLEEVEAARQKSSGICFGGNDALQSPHLVPLVRRAREIGFQSVLVMTPGTRLAGREFAAQLRDAGVTQLVLTLHGPDAERHDTLAGRPGGFEAVRSAVENLRELGVPVIFNLPLTRMSLAHHYQTALVCESWGVDYRLLLWYPDEPYRAQFERLAPSLAELRSAFEVWRDHDSLPRYDHLPRCVLPMEAREDTDIAPFFDPGIAPRLLKPEPCRGCGLSERCQGVYDLFLERWGADDLEPWELSSGGGEEPLRIC